MKLNFCDHCGNSIEATDLHTFNVLKGDTKVAEFDFDLCGKCAEELIHRVSTFVHDTDMELDGYEFDTYIKFKKKERINGRQTNISSK